MRFFAAALFFFGAAASNGQAPEVPHKMQFAGMTLTIRDDAKREIQKDVDALTQYSRYYTLKVERAKTYFPIIEKILEEEHVPDDFKFLVLQESALVPDAVSVSNAVGFWQFKDVTATEMGLRVDKDIDERMNLVSATRGAARYLKQSNFYFNNWLYALQAYQMGTGGVKRSVGDLQNGAKNMDITSDTYWYVKKFLAHKVAFENTAQGEGQTRVIPYQINQAKSLKEIAVEVSSDETTLKEYNKWLKTDRVPEDKPYTILIPVGKLDMDFNKLVLSSSRASKAQPLPPSKENENQKISVNGIPAIRAKAGETISDLVKRSPISITAFLKYNDIAIDHPLEPGSLYLLGKKKTKSNEVNCKVKPGDDLWAISQRYGVRLKKLMKYNLLEENQRLVVGSWVWLNATKPKDQSFVVSQDEVAQLSENEAFDWYTKTPKTTEAIPLVTSTLVQKGAQDSVLRNQEPERSGSSLTKTHTVSPGETFYSIAKQYSLPVRDVLTWNDLTIQSSLKPGQVLKVAADETGPTHAQETVVGPELKALLHEVKSSDTLYSIARQYGVTIRNLLEWNNKKEFTLTVGEKLRIIQK